MRVQDRIETLRLECLGMVGVEEKMRTGTGAEEEWVKDNTDQERLAYLGRVGMSARRVSTGFRNAGLGKGGRGAV